MEKTNENIDKVIFNLRDNEIVAPNDEAHLKAFVPLLREAYLNGTTLEEVKHPELGDVPKEYTWGFPFSLQENLELIFDTYTPDSRTKFRAEAEKIIVKVGEKEFETYLDERGVQRFVGNTINRYIVTGDTQKNGDHLLNDMIKAVQRGQFSIEDYLDFETSHGWSVSGFCDLWIFDHLEISNPLWD